MIVSIIPTPVDCTLEPYDFSKLTAIFTCDTLGILQHGLHKGFKSGKRAMALEAGQACHDVFAAQRLWQLTHVDKLPDHADFRGKTLFGDERWSRLKPMLFVSQPDRPDHLSFGIQALETSGFYDDPDDNKRTIAKLTETCIAYMDRASTEWPVYVQDRSDITKFIGIEIPFDFLVTFHDGFQFRFIGRTDGVHIHSGEEPWVHENKTGSRIDQNWMNMMEISHQITGYMIAISGLLQQNMRYGMVHGAAIPLPKAYDFGGINNVVVERKAHHYISWELWVREGINRYERWRDNPFESPKCTHSCNRYFRTCSYIDFCKSNRRDQEQLIEMMDHIHWSPLDEKVND